MRWPTGGYFKDEEILACELIGVTPYVPKPLTSGAKAEGRFGKQDLSTAPKTTPGDVRPANV
jgi:transposase